MRPSAPVEMLSGWPGRLAASVRDRAGLRTGEPVLRQPTSLRLGEHQRRPVGGRCHAVGEVQPGHDGQHGAVGIAPEQAAARACLEHRALEVRVGERARRLGEIDCAVGCFGDIRAELQRPAVDLVDQRLELAAAGVHRQQAARDCRRPAGGRRGRRARPSGRPPVSPTTAVADRRARSARCGRRRRRSRCCRRRRRRRPRARCPERGRRSGRPARTSGSGSTGGGCQRTGSTAASAVRSCASLAETVFQQAFDCWNTVSRQA